MTEPIKYTLKLLFGFDIGQAATQNVNKTINHNLLEQTWKNASTPPNNLGILARALLLFKKVMFIAVGLAVGIIGVFFYRQKVN